MKSTSENRQQNCTSLTWQSSHGSPSAKPQSFPHEAKKGR